VITTICAPPTLVAGIYGMNFNPDSSPYNMPELNWYFGYPLALVLMVALSAALFMFILKPLKQLEGSTIIPSNVPPPAQSDKANGNGAS
ncbi:MAG TPA: CorA family divalent cation transporter, partial [Candidatus Obscuribacter sp.]|nr:CorA family divalent cation transporter [Candidatus Obscuribacter sp.]